MRWTLCLLTTGALTGATLLCYAGSDWRWEDDVSPERREELAPVRDRLQRDLKALGPAPKERLAALPKLTAEERKGLDEMIRRWQYRPNLGHEDKIRDNWRDKVIDTYGLKAFDVLVEKLRGKSFWYRRTASEAMRILTEKHGDRVRWLLYHHDVPSLQIALIGAGPWAEQVGVRREVDAALKVITGADPLPEVRRSFAWKNADVTKRTALVQKAWRDAWAEEKKRWTKAEEKRTRQRKLVRAQLEQVRAGRLPAGLEKKRG